MLELQAQPLVDLPPDACLTDIAPTHPSFPAVYGKIKKWLRRFYLYDEEPIFNELCLFYRLTTKNYLDHRSPQHLFNIVLSISFLQKQLQHSLVFSSKTRHLKIRWMPTLLSFPFASKSVMGCLVGFNEIDRYELFDEENITLALIKHFPHVRLLKESFYCHTSRHKALKIFYFELEKKDREPFSLTERNQLRSELEEKLKNSIQPLSPTIFMNFNEEEVYKHILVLSREIESCDDLPQVYITLAQQTSKDITFRVVIVYVAPFHQFSLKDRFFDCVFVGERCLTVRHIDGRPIDAQIFQLILPRDAGCVRSDGSLDFYHTREKIVACMKGAVGEFRDYNGGILLKQQELFHEFKGSFPEEAEKDHDLMAAFFYTLMPLEKRILLQLDPLASLFSYFSDVRQEKWDHSAFFSCQVHEARGNCFIVIRTHHSEATGIINSALLTSNWSDLMMVYHFLDVSDEIFFNCALLQADEQRSQLFIQGLQHALQAWAQEKKSQQTLRIGSECWPSSLDPRTGGDNITSDVLRLLFEGLTRFDAQGDVENGLAQSIEVSSDLTQYTFRLHASSWNDGSPVSARDFEYAWKKILSPRFRTGFASFFYLIKNAKQAKEGHASLDAVGVHAVDDLTLRVELNHPAPYFLHLTALPLYSPIHRLTDQYHPQWTHQSGKHYPCNGPFQLKLNKPDQCYHFIKNPYYREKQSIVLDQIILKQMNPYQALQAFRKGELDWIGNPLGGWHLFYTPEQDDQLLTAPERTTSWCVFNTNTFPFNHRKLRQAISRVINRDEIVASISFPLSPAYSLLLPALSNRKTSFPSFDPQKGKELFESFLEDIKMKKEDFPPISLVVQQTGLRAHVAPLFKKQIENALSIECRLDPLLWKPFSHRITERSFQMSLIQWACRIKDPSYTLNSFQFAQEKINFSNWENPEYKRLLNLANLEPNPFQRSTYLMQAEQLLSEEVPACPLLYQPMQILIKKNINISMNAPFGTFSLSNCFKRKEFT